jgi:hypothetical protein
MIKNTSAYGCFVMACQIEDAGYPQMFALPFFSTISEQLSITNNVAKHPLDNGLFVNDHVNQEPDTFDVAFNVSEMLIGAEAVYVTQFVGQVRSSDVYETQRTVTNTDETGQVRSVSVNLRRNIVYDEDVLRNMVGEKIAAYERVLMQYRNMKWELNTTRHGVLDDYMITSVSFNAGASAQSVEIRINFQKVRFATSSNVLLPTIPQAVKAAATTSTRSRGGRAIGGLQMKKLDLGGGFDLNWDLGNLMPQLGAESLARKLYYGSSGSPGGNPLATDGTGTFPVSMPEVEDPLAVSLP